MKNHTSHKYDFMHSKDPIPRTILSRKMIGILNKNDKLMTHKDGHLLIFYKTKDAKLWLSRNKLTDLCKMIKIKVDIIQN